MDSSSSLPEQQQQEQNEENDSEIVFKIPPEEWKELMRWWSKKLAKVDIETFRKQWMDHPKKAAFMNWRDASGDIANGATMLICAIWAGRSDIADLLLEHGADSNIADYYGDTPLINAADKGHDDIVKLLLDKGADIKIASKGGSTALISASYNGHTDVVQLLLEEDADSNIADEDGWTALMWASEKGHTNIVKLLLEKDADSNVASEDGNTALINAADKGHNDIVKLLVENGADSKTVNEKGWTALMKASSKGLADIVKLLLEKDADLNVANENGNTALMEAYMNLHADIVKLLLEKDADSNIASKNGWTALMMASCYGHADIVKLLLEKGADVNIANKWGNTALIDAAEKGHANIVKLLLEKDADINIASNNGWTALTWASKNGHVDIVKLLLQKHADLNIANKNGWTALMWASREGHADIMKLLLEKDADFNIANKDGWTALMWASKNGHTKVVGLLVEKGAVITDKEQETTFMKAAEEGHNDTVKVLVETGMDIDIADEDGDTALMLASRKRHTKTVELLLEMGADCKITNKQGRNAFTEAYFQDGTEMVDLLLDKAPLKDIIHDIVKFPKFANKFLHLFQENRDIVHWRDVEGRTVRQLACKECREAILFLSRFDVDDKPMYESPTCKIYRALDYGGRHKNLKQPRRVAMKFMEQVEHFLNEMRARRNDDGSPRFSPAFVTPDLVAYSADQDPEYAKACKTFNLPKYCLVMPLADRSLMEAMNNEYLSAQHKDLQRREILLTLSKIFAYLHEVGYVHGDIKAHNVVRHIDGGNITWKAIDFDACTKIGDTVGLKVTTGSAPPEMLKIVQGEDPKIVLRQPGTDGLDGSDLLKADTSFDVWSFGILMYQLVTGGSFFHCDLQGNVVDGGLQEWANLTQHRINKKLECVNDTNARVLLSNILRINPEERPTMSEIGENYYFHPSESPQGRKADFFGKQVFSIFVPRDIDDAPVEKLDDTTSEENPTPSTLESIEKPDASSKDEENVKELKRFLSAKSDEFSYFKLRDEDKDWSDQLLNSEVETFHFDELGGMGVKPKFIDGDTIYYNKFLCRLLSEKGPDYFMGFLVEYFELYKIMQDAHQICQGIKANLVSDVKSLKGIFIKLFVRGKGLNDVVRGTLFCNSVDQFKYVGRQLQEQYGHNVYIKPPKQEAGAWPIPKLLVYGNRRFHGRCLSVEIQFSTVYMHLATRASNNHLVYEAIRESTGYLGDKGEEFQEFLQSLNQQYIDTEGFLQNQAAQEGRFEILVEQPADERDDSGEMQCIPKATGFITSGRICCGNQFLFQFMSPKDHFQRFSESSFVVNKSLTLLSSHSIKLFFLFGCWT